MGLTLRLIYTAEERKEVILDRLTGFLLFSREFWHWPDIYAHLSKKTSLLMLLNFTFSVKHSFAKYLRNTTLQSPFVTGHTDLFLSSGIFGSSWS